MSFPQVISPGTPLGTDSPAQGDDEFRALKLFISEVFGLPQSPLTIGGPVSLVGVDGQAPTVVRLSNQTGGDLVAGDAVAISVINDKAVVLADTVESTRMFVYAAESIPSGDAGRFFFAGVIVAKSQGSIARGEYVRKSATTKAIETIGVTVTEGIPPPQSTIGMAVAASSSGFTTIIVPVRGVSGFAVSGRGDNEATTSATGSVDLVTIPVNIPVGYMAIATGRYRKTGVHASTASLGYKFNGTQIVANIVCTTANAQAEDGGFVLGNAFGFYPGITNYTHTIGGAAPWNLRAWDTIGGTYAGYSSAVFANPIPSTAITSITITGLVANATNTLAVDDTRVFCFGGS